jgi:hypothetical protein
MHTHRNQMIGACGQGWEGGWVSARVIRVPGTASPGGKWLLFGISMLVLRILLVGECVWAQAEVSFLARRNFRVGARPTSVAVGDFNGDGHLDLATANADANTVSILLGQGDGRFVAAPEVGVGRFLLSVVVGDFNGDGHLDLATGGARCRLCWGRAMAALWLPPRWG